MISSSLSLVPIYASLKEILTMMPVQVSSMHRNASAVRCRTEPCIEMRVQAKAMLHAPKYKCRNMQYGSAMHLY